MLGHHSVPGSAYQSALSHRTPVQVSVPTDRRVFRCQDFCVTRYSSRLPSISRVCASNAGTVEVTKDVNGRQNHITNATALCQRLQLGGLGGRSRASIWIMTTYGTRQAVIATRAHQWSASNSAPMPK